MSFIVIIPARYFSVRFPGKPLANVNGQPMIVRIMEIALMSDAEKVIIATDHIDIFNVIKNKNTAADVVLTRLDHRSGTERIGEVVKNYNFLDHQIIVNLQGDEPLISSDMVNQVANDLSSIHENNVSMSTLAIRMCDINDKDNSNIVKVVVDMKNNALYFSRSMIPWCKKEFVLIGKKYIENVFLRHIGIYAYRVNFIYRYINWKVTPLEIIESLEQLRVLWYGEKIHVSVINNNIYYANIDTYEELHEVNVFLGKLN